MVNKLKLGVVTHCVLCKVFGPGYGYHYEPWKM
jgi:hypothetical protein